MRFTDRSDAGRQLAGRLTHLEGRNAIVLALPRGGVPVAFEIARTLRAPLDVLNVRKLGVPWHEELAMGAIATGGVRVVNEDVIRSLGLTEADLEEITTRQRAELDRRERLYRGGRPGPSLDGRTVILVDDGIATGATARAAINAIRSQQPARIVLAVPVVQASVAIELAREVDELVYEVAPESLYAIGVWYDDFRQLSDDDVRVTLAKAVSDVGAPTATIREKRNG